MAKATIDNFYVLRPLIDHDSKWMWLDFSCRIDQLGLNAKQEIMDEALEPDIPVPFKLWRGTLKPDVFGNTATVKVYSGRLIRALQNAQCRGLDVRQAIIYDTHDSSMYDKDAYWARVRVGAGALDRSRGSCLLLTDHWKRRDPMLRTAVGYYCDPTTWTGMDIFRLSDSAHTVITKRMAEAIQQIAPLGTLLEPAREEGKRLRDARVAFLKRRYPDMYAEIAEQ